ncbi:IclR family transcriptional regulator [Mesorhizobium sp.]|jgi:DNA-binding IclR family transcriptional regulator|uniref:IclR family transcriptional regulator n=1 Tax=Mesorhizobium sp. TaxID=1871066 RepID=UPI000FE8920A|nr:IclR family transcriptional regulator [Mesorhizobium sp.]RWP36312.1 MAG: IclR family transcriptional regulator [Mesorhizobium sp.]TIL65016.1 MAG: IclR family transcriptional regulator [Mesorhizobium sp.]
MAADIAQIVDDGESGRNGYRVPAVEKALDVLEFMASSAEPLTQTEIAAGLGRSIHEIYRILLLLEKRGYIFRTQSDRFRLSLKLFELAHMHPPVNRLVECALPVMRELSANTDQSCHLVVREGESALVVLQIDSPLPMRYSVALGSHFPILETSSGAVLLAHSNRAERDRIVERIVAAGEGQGTRAEIEARLNEVAGLGYEMRASLAVEACTNVSMPVRDHTGAVIAALTVPFLPQKAARFDRETVFERAKAAAETISAALGAGEAIASSRADPGRRDYPFSN